MVANNCLKNMHVYALVRDIQLEDTDLLNGADSYVKEKLRMTLKTQIQKQRRTSHSFLIL